MIPRAVEQIFAGIEERRTAAMERNEPPPQFEIIAQFLEVCQHMLKFSGSLMQWVYCREWTVLNLL